MIAGFRAGILLAALLLEPASLELIASSRTHRPPTAIVVRIQGARNDEGLLRIALFQTADGFPEHNESASRTASLEPQDGVVEARFEDVTTGAWAVAVLHDENGNGRLDCNFLGIPKEGVGASNDAVRFGLPSFEKARVVVPEGGVSMTVKLHYWM